MLNKVEYKNYYQASIILFESKYDMIQENDYYNIRIFRLFFQYIYNI